MADRIEAGFRERFRRLLARSPVADSERGARLLLARGRGRARSGGEPLALVLAALFEEVRDRVERTWPVAAADPPPRLACDRSLAGLARWLRAAGHPAALLHGSREALLFEAAGSVLLTSDSRLLGHPRARAGEPRVLWVPVFLDPARQARLVLHDLGLDLREPHCMACGGRLVPTSKAAVADRIPPRTARWLDSYAVCAGCGGLFWEGTHWLRIRERLSA